MAKSLRRQFSTEQKVALLRRHLIDGVPVSQPSLFYHWQHLLFENASRVFDRPSSSPQAQKADQRVAFLEKRLSRKGEMIAEISEEYVKLKKSTLGALTGRWVPHDTRDEIVDFVRWLSEFDRDRLRSDPAMDRARSWQVLRVGQALWQG